MFPLEAFSDYETLIQASAEKFVRLAAEVIGKRKIFVVALSGGSIPQRLYALLAPETFGRSIDWSRAHPFWGDERGGLLLLKTLSAHPIV